MASSPIKITLDASKETVLVSYLSSPDPEIDKISISFLDPQEYLNLLSNFPGGKIKLGSLIILNVVMGGTPLDTYKGKLVSCAKHITSANNLVVELGLGPVK